MSTVPRIPFAEFLSRCWRCVATWSRASSRLMWKFRTIARSPLVSPKVDTHLVAMNAGNKLVLEGARTILASSADAATGARQISAAAEEATNARSTGSDGGEPAGTRHREEPSRRDREIASLAEALKQQNSNT